jgi:hypothetical protein
MADCNIEASGAVSSGEGLSEESPVKPLAVIIRQTNYTEEIAQQKLLEHNGDVMKVIREYINPSGKTGLVSPPKLSTNQRVYKEIRTMMDAACRTYESNKQH